MATFSLSRSTSVAAPPEVVHALVDDFRRWPTWSPWEGVDPDLQRTYTGPAAGVGTHYHWKGNAKAGEGDMEVTASEPTRVVIDLTFLKPFKAANVTTFDLTPSGAGTHVTWSMTGRRNPVMAVLGALWFDRMVGRDFERGLAGLKTAAERT